MLQITNRSGVAALQIARQQFSNLSCEGILGSRFIAKPIDTDDIERAMYILRQCRKTKVPNISTYDICRVIDVQAGATIAGCVALGFEARSWYGVTAFVPHAFVNLNTRDFWRAVALSTSN